MQESQPSQSGLIAAIVFAAVVVSGSLGFLGYQMSGQSGNAVAQENVDKDTLTAMLQEMDKNDLAALVKDLQSQVNAPYEELVDDDAFLGDDDAPVTIVEFSDYQCPFCQRHYQQTVPQIISNYIDTGKVKYVFRDFPLSFHADAKPAAIAASCAGEQGGNELYFKMNNKLFAGSQSNLKEATFVQYATELDLDLVAFKTCLKEDRHGQEVDADIAAGASFGISGTPGFVITDGESSKLVSGAQPYAVFKSEIDKRLQ